MSFEDRNRIADLENELAEEKKNCSELRAKLGEEIHRRQRAARSEGEWSWTLEIRKTSGSPNGECYCVRRLFNMRQRVCTMLRRRYLQMQAEEGTARGAACSGLRRGRARAAI